MPGLEVDGKSVEEAVARALEELGLTEDEVEIEVLREPKPGIFGFGATDARVRVSPRRQAALPKARPSPRPVDVPTLAKQTIEDLLRAMDVSAQVEVRETPAPEGGSAPPQVTVDITGDDLGILIGRRGDTLSSLQYIVNLIISRRLKMRAGVTVDVEGYRQRREQSLRALALRLADRVRATGEPAVLEPMPAAERRIIHLALADDPDVRTESSGVGEERKVHILPRAD